jgi:hypothetical protein
VCSHRPRQPRAPLGRFTLRDCLTRTSRGQEVRPERAAAVCYEVAPPSPGEPAGWAPALVGTGTERPRSGAKRCRLETAVGIGARRGCPTWRRWSRPSGELTLFEGCLPVAGDRAGVRVDQRVYRPLGDRRHRALRLAGQAVRLHGAVPQSGRHRPPRPDLQARSQVCALDAALWKCAAGTSLPSRQSPRGILELVSLWDPPYGTTRSRSPTGCRHPERSSAGSRSGRAAGARAASPLASAGPCKRPRQPTSRTSIRGARRSPSVSQATRRSLASGNTNISTLRASSIAAPGLEAEGGAG